MQNFNSLKSLDLAIKSCKRCLLYKDCGSYGPTLPEGYNDVEIMVLGRNPGYDELVGGRPFIGRAGQKMDTFLFAVGLSRRDCWITNTCKCYSSNNRPPMYEEIVSCSDYFKAELEIIKPKFIISFGAEAMSMVTPYTGRIMRHCGELLNKPKSSRLGIKIDARVAICVHPSAVLRSNRCDAEWNHAIRNVKDFLVETEKK